MNRPADLLVIDPRDNVATALRGLAAGDTARVGSAPEAAGSAGPGGAAGAGRGSLPLLQAIPPYHKASLRDIARGEAIIKYGEAIGTALRDIRAGEHVHVHNLAGRRAGSREAPGAPA